MSNAATPDLTARAYDAPHITQFSVFLANKVGKLGELLDVFYGEALRLCALSVNDATDHAVVRVVTSRAQLARKLLNEHDMPFSETEVLAVELPEGETFNRLCRYLISAELNIQYAYPLMVRPHGAAIIALHTDDQTLAGQILGRKNFSLIGEIDLIDPSSYTGS